MLNRVILTGYAGREAEVRFLESGSAVANFSLATSEGYKNSKGEWIIKTEWHNIKAWNAIAEKIGKEVSKGDLVYIEGKLETTKWEDNSGVSRSKTEVVVTSFRSLVSRS